MTKEIRLNTIGGYISANFYEGIQPKRLYCHPFVGTFLKSVIIEDESSTCKDVVNLVITAEEPERIMLYRLSVDSGAFWYCGSVNIKGCLDIDNTLLQAAIEYWNRYASIKNTITDSRYVTKGLFGLMIKSKLPKNTRKELLRVDNGM